MVNSDFRPKCASSVLANRGEILVFPYIAGWIFIKKALCFTPGPQMVSMLPHRLVLLCKQFQFWPRGSIHKAWGVNVLGVGASLGQPSQGGLGRVPSGVGSSHLTLILGWDLWPPIQPRSWPRRIQSFSPFRLCGMNPTGVKQDQAWLERPGQQMDSTL